MPSALCGLAAAADGVGNHLRAPVITGEGPYWIGVWGLDDPVCRDADCRAWAGVDRLDVARSTPHRAGNKTQPDAHTGPPVAFVRTFDEPV